MSARLRRRIPTAPSLVPFLLAALAVLLPVAAGGQEGGRSLVIESFDATLRVEEDGWLEVRERIEVAFRGSWNGIYRDIPVEYRTPQGFSYGLFLDDVTVLDGAGEPLEYTSSREGPYRRLKIRVPGAQDATRTVQVHYRVPNALRFHEEYDELYWNVTGDEWQMPIRRASAMVLLPDGAEHTRAASWTGGYGSSEDAAESTEIEQGFYFETTEELAYREGLTVAVAWAPGLVAAPSSFTRLRFFLRSNWPFFLPLLSLLLMWRWWWHRGRDPQRRSVAPQYAPPRGLRPAEAGTLVDNRPDLRDITAVVVDLAVRGWLRIEETGGEGMLSRLLDGRDYALTPLRPRRDWAELEPHERRVLEGLFAGGVDHEGIPAAVELSELKNEFYSELPGIRSSVFDSLVSKGFYEERPDKVQQRWMGIGAVLMGLGVVGGMLVAETFTLSPLTGVLAGVLTGLPVLAFGVFMPARTVQGTRALEEVLGFEEFLERVESDRFRRMIQGPEMFEAYLPYAMAFGVAEKWARAFEDLYTEPPDWYRGRWDGRFHALYLTNSLSSMSTTAASTMTSAPRSSGGSGFSGGGGGGFSGGGFGGGGGGGW